MRSGPPAEKNPSLQDEVRPEPALLAGADPLSAGPSSQALPSFSPSLSRQEKGTSNEEEDEDFAYTTLWVAALAGLCLGRPRLLCGGPIRGGRRSLKVYFAQVHVSGLPVHTLVAALHLLRWCDHHGEHRASAGPGGCRCWCAGPARGPGPANACPLSSSMNTSSSRRRVIGTEGAEPPRGPGPGGAGAPEQTGLC